MRNRRLPFLAGLLVALNVALWLAPPGLAIKPALVRQFFGGRLVRAELIESCGAGCIADWRADRGVITNASATTVTVREADGRVQSIPLSSSTQVLQPWGRAIPLARLAHGHRRALVMWPANGAAVSVAFASRAKPLGFQGVGSAYALIHQLLGSKLVRTEVIDQNGPGATADTRLDRGVVVAVSATGVTVKEADGRVQAIALSSATRVTLNTGRAISTARLRRGWRVFVEWPANGAAVWVNVEARAKARAVHSARHAAAPLPRLS